MLMLLLEAIGGAAFTAGTILFLNGEFKDVQIGVGQSTNKVVTAAADAAE